MCLPWLVVVWWACEREVTAGLPSFSLCAPVGAYSARWSGVHGDDQANIEKLLLELTGKPSRCANFICVVALVFPTGHPHHDEEIIEEGRLHGEIVAVPRGNAGFGYDPIFAPTGFALTLGEFGPGEKDAISHRGIAMRAIAPQISALLS